MEGALWVDARTDLGDLFRGTLTLRQVWVRLQALPADALIWHVIRDEQAREKSEARERRVDSAVDMMRRRAAEHAARAARRAAEEEG